MVSNQLMFIHKHIKEDHHREKTLACWLEEAKLLGDEGVFIASDVEDKFSRLERHCDADPNCHAYLLFDDEADEAATAVLDFSHAMGHTSSSWLKLLNIYLKPSLLPDSFLIPNDEKYDRISAAYGKAIATAIALIFDGHPSKELKIYARTNEMRTYFKAIINYRPLADKLQGVGLVMFMESSWFVVRKSD